MLALLCCFLSACQASDALVPPRSPNVLKIGFVAPFEGRYRYIGYDAVTAARMAIREINGAGGVAGWYLELVAYDDRGIDEMAATIAGNLVVDPDVIAVIGHYRPESSAAAAPIYAESDLPQVMLGGWVSADGRVIHLMPEPDAVARAMVAVGGADDALSTVIWRDDLIDVIAADALQRATIGSSPSSATADTAVILTALPPVDTAAQLLEMVDQEWNGQLVGAGDLAAPAFGLTAGADAAGTRFVTPYPFPLDLPHTESWRASYLAVGPHVPEPGPYALPTYEAVYLLADGIAAVMAEAPALDRSALAEALGSVRRTGLLGKIELDAQGYWRDAPLYVYGWRDDGPQLLQAQP